MRTLIIIDMQDNFLEYLDSFRQKEVKELKLNIIDLTKVWMVNGWPIIVVEYAGSDKTCQEILDIINGYDQYYFAIKDQCDGSEEIMDVIDEFRLPHSLNICGVYSNECVFFTKERLKEYKDIEFVIHKDCVWPFVKENEIHKKEREQVLS